MKKRVLAILLCALVALVLAGCDFFTGLFWPKVTLADAKEAWTATGVFANEALFNATTRVDNQSDPYYAKFTNSGSTVFAEMRTTGGTYPMTMTLTAVSYVEVTSGYTISGTSTTTITSSSASTGVFDLDFVHGTKPVKKIAGTLAGSGSTTTGSLKFNNDSYAYADFTAAP
jgi:hypothetical protein